MWTRFTANYILFTELLWAVIKDERRTAGLRNKSLSATPSQGHAAETSASSSVFCRASHLCFTENTTFSGEGQEWTGTTSGILSTEKCREYHGPAGTQKPYFSGWSFCVSFRN